MVRASQRTAVQAVRVVLQGLCIGVVLTGKIVVTL